jgi:hypothetical protein
MKKGGTLKMVEANGTDNNNIRSMVVMKYGSHAVLNPRWYLTPNILGWGSPSRFSSQITLSRFSTDGKYRSHTCGVDYGVGKPAAAQPAGQL